MISNPIGIFDSGIGGLTVFKEVSRLLPCENIVYLGDTARVPYGSRSEETIIRYSFECADFLLKQKIKILVIACNTVSSVNLAAIKQRLSIPVIGVIEPGAQAAVRATKNKRIGVIGTEATIMSSAYTKAIRSIDDTVEVFSTACPLFVPLVEEGWGESEIARLVAEKYLSLFVEKNIDTIVLGCTHYPLLKNVIKQVISRTAIIDSGVETGNALECILRNHSLLKTDQSQGQHNFFVTDSVKRFSIVGERFLQRRFNTIEKVTL
ncbi:MAG: glutamate racemase [Nitrospirota bacterium]